MRARAAHTAWRRWLTVVLVALLLAAVGAASLLQGGSRPAGATGLVFGCPEGTSTMGSFLGIEIEAQRDGFAAPDELLDLDINQMLVAIVGPPEGRNLDVDEDGLPDLRWNVAFPTSNADTNLSDPLGPHRRRPLADPAEHQPGAVARHPRDARPPALGSRGRPVRGVGPGHVRDEHAGRSGRPRWPVHDRDHLGPGRLRHPRHRRHRPDPRHLRRRHLRQPADQPRHRLPRRPVRHRVPPGQRSRSPARHPRHRARRHDPRAGGPGDEPGSQPRPRRRLGPCARPARLREGHQLRNARCPSRRSPGTTAPTRPARAATSRRPTPTSTSSPARPRATRTTTRSRSMAPSSTSPKS